MSNDVLVTALLSLTKDNIPTDVQELLISGDPMRGIPPGALVRAIEECNEELATVVADAWKATGAEDIVFDDDGNEMPLSDVIHLLAKYGNRDRKFQAGDRVTKISGGSWTGRVVGFYVTSLTPIGYAVESENEPGSVQIYPEKALRRVERWEP